MVESKEAETRRVAILGGSGLLGQELACRLLDNNVEVVILDLNSPAQELADHKMVSYYPCDITNVENCQIEKILNGVEIVYYKVGLLGNPNLSSEIESAWEFMNVNAFSLLRLMPVFQGAGIKKLIVDSSITAVSDLSRIAPLEECDFPSIPTNYYGLSKAILEDICMTERHPAGIETIIIRYPRVYSPFQNNFINIIASKIANHEPIQLFGNVDKIVDIVHINDATELAVKCMDYEGNATVFHAAYGNPVSLKVFVEMILKAFGYESYPINISADSMSPREPNSSSLMDTMSLKELNFNYVSSVEEIVQEAVDQVKYI